MYETGKTEDNPDAKGLTFPIHPKLKTAAAAVIVVVVVVTTSSSSSSL